MSEMSSSASNDKTQLAAVRRGLDVCTEDIEDVSVTVATVSLLKKHCQQMMTSKMLAATLWEWPQCLH